MRRPKLCRTERGATRPLALTKRDMEILLLIGLCRYLSSEQVARAVVMSADRCRRRLRVLFNAQLISVTLQSSTRPNLLSLTRRGLRLLLEQAPEAASRARLAGPLKYAAIEHHLGIVDCRLYAAARGAAEGTPLLRWSNAGGELHRELNLAALHLDSDGIAEFGQPEGRLIRIGIEFDRSTEPLSTLASKLLRYRPAAEDQRLHGLWLVISGGERRIKNLVTTVEAAGLTSWVEVLSHQQIATRPVLVLPRSTAWER